MHDHHDTVVVSDRSPVGAIVAVIALVLIIALGWYFLAGPGEGTLFPAEVDVNVQAPAERGADAP